MVIFHVSASVSAERVNKIQHIHDSLEYFAQI